MGFKTRQDSPVDCERFAFLRRDILDGDSLDTSDSESLKEAVREHPRDPVFLFRYLIDHSYLARRSRFFGNRMSVEADRREAEAQFQRVLRDCEKLLQKSLKSPEMRALERAWLVVQTISDLAEEPTPKVLEEAEKRLDRYKAMRDEPIESWEFFSANYHQCECDYVAGRGRQCSWQALASGDYSFLPDYVEQADLEWSMDPLFLSSDFQAWAHGQIAEGKKKKSAPFHYWCSSSYEYEANVDPAQMPSLVYGRLLGALLAGVDASGTASNLLSNALPDRARLLEALLLSGLSVNAVTDTDTGDTLLHAAARVEDVGCIQTLLAAGADLSLKNKKRKRADGVTTSAAVKRALLGEIDSPVSTVVVGKLP